MSGLCSVMLEGGESCLSLLLQIHKSSEESILMVMKKETSLRWHAIISRVVMNGDAWKFTKSCPKKWNNL